MKALFVTLFMVLTGIGLASAGEEHESIAVKIVKTGDGEPVVHWIGDDEDVNVEFIDDEDIHVQVIDGGPNITTRVETLTDGIVIASGDAIDETTQETIRSVLATAGYDAEVRFIERSLHASHVKVIKERVEKFHED